METPPKSNPRPDLRPTERFSNRVENYIRYRPGYPPELLDCLRQNCGLTKGSMIADVGSGTGKLAELFLENGNRVFGIEPNHAMREGGERLLSKYPNFSSEAATAGREPHPVATKSTTSRSARATVVELMWSPKSLSAAVTRALPSTAIR